VRRYFLGRLGDGGGEPILRVVRVGDKFRFGDFLFIDVLNPRPEPGGGPDGFRNIHAGLAVTTFLPDDIPTLLIHNSWHIAATMTAAAPCLMGSTPSRCSHSSSSRASKPLLDCVRNSRTVFTRAGGITPCL